jgi:hypothetical protein
MGTPGLKICKGVFGLFWQATCVSWLSLPPIRYTLPIFFRSIANKARNRAKRPSLCAGASSAVYIMDTCISLSCRPGSKSFPLPNAEPIESNRCSDFPRALAVPAIHSATMPSVDHSCYCFALTDFIWSLSRRIKTSTRPTASASLLCQHDSLEFSAFGLWRDIFNWLCDACRVSEIHLARCLGVGGPCRCHFH